jgi:FkbM family methyltransferase
MIDPAQIVAEFDCGLSSESRRVAETVLSGEGAGRCYVVGRNTESMRVANVVKIEGLVDDTAPPGSLWLGHPVLGLKQLPADAVVINCSTSISPVSVRRRLASVGAVSIDYCDICRVDPERFALPRFVIDTRAELDLHVDAWSRLRKQFADHESVQVLDDLLRYRLTGDSHGMESYKVRLAEQYFEPFIQLEEGAVFVDAGGFDGDTTQEFCRRYPDYRRVLLFEPSPENLARARRRLADVRDVEFVPLGVSDMPGSLGFDPSSGSASSISEAGSMAIEVTTLDEYVDEAVSLIKMDLEGWEERALRGSEQHIRDDHPYLAISVYHASADFRRVPELVLGLRDDYKVYLRHYTEGWSETVMTFVPI